MALDGLHIKVMQVFRVPVNYRACSRHCPARDAIYGRRQYLSHLGNRPVAQSKSDTGGGSALLRISPSGPRILDFGGGSGSLCRLFRDIGFDAHTREFAVNDFGQGFEDDGTS